MATDHEGREIPVDEPDDVVIKVWQIEPHPNSSEYDCYIERSWQRMLAYVGEHLDKILETPSIDELERETFVLKFSIRSMAKRDYLDACEDV